MSAGQVERKLAAIFAADVEGYSRLMGIDEVGTLRTLTAYREIIDGLIAQHRGRIFNTAGDSVLAEFASVVDAVQCAVDIQRALGEENRNRSREQQMQFRVGVHVGDVLVQGDNLFGDGVNIAARLETLAEPGGVCVSGSVRDYVGKKLPVVFTDCGEQGVKNIAEPVRAYRIGANATVPIGAKERPPLPLPDKPSIAVLPFTNMSGDPEQEYFADGLTEDLITDLSRITDLFVIARNSSFIYKGKSVDVRQVAHEMGVRFILEGSARQASGRVRINAQLIDAVGGGHLWADRFDRDLADIFAVQDEVVSKIVSALVGRLSEVKLPTAKRPANLEAYECCVRGRILRLRSAEAGKAARLLFEKSVALDPQFAEAHAWLALTYLSGWMFWGEPTDPYRPLALTTARRAVALDPDDAAAHSTLGVIQLYEKRWAEAAGEFETALRLNPNHAHTWSAMSELFVFKGEPDQGIDCAKRGLRLDPVSPICAFYLGQAQYAARRYDDAIETLQRDDWFASSRRLLAASLAQVGRIDDARKEANRFMLAHPHFSVSYWSSTQPSRDEAARQHFVEGYLKAGLPE